MKLKSVDRVLEDYHHYHALTQNYFVDFDNLCYYFAPGLIGDRALTDDSLANNIGELSLNYLESYILRALFVENDNWVKVSATTDPQKAATIEKALYTHIEASNFREEIGKMLQMGLLFKVGYLTVDFVNSITFKNHLGLNLVVTDSVSSLRRAYSLEAKDYNELRQQYTNYDHEQSHNGVPGRIVEVLRCILPTTDQWFSDPNPVMNFAEIVIDLETEELLVPRTEKDMPLYSVFPVAQYTPHTSRSLARQASNSAYIANYYEQLDAEKAEVIKVPPVNADAINVESGNVSLACWSHKQHRAWLNPCFTRGNTHARRHN